MPPLPGAIVLVLAPFAPLFRHLVWLHRSSCSGRDPYAWGTHRHGRLAGDRYSYGAPLHLRPSGFEPGLLVRPQAPQWESMAHASLLLLFPGYSGAKLPTHWRLWHSTNPSRGCGLRHQVSIDTM